MPMKNDLALAQLLGYELCRGAEKLACILLNPASPKHSSQQRNSNDNGIVHFSIIDKVKPELTRRLLLQ